MVEGSTDFFQIESEEVQTVPEDAKTSHKLNLTDFGIDDELLEPHAAGGRQVRLAGLSAGRGVRARRGCPSRRLWPGVALTTARVACGRLW